MYILFEYVMCVAFAFVVGVSLFVATALVLFAKNIWQRSMMPHRWERLRPASLRELGGTTTGLDNLSSLG